MLYKSHLVEAKVEAGLRVEETGYKAIEKLQACPDEKRDPKLCVRTHTHTHTHTHTQLVLPLLRHPGMSHTWPHAPTEPPRGYLSYALSSYFPSVVNPNGFSLPD